MGRPKHSLRSAVSAVAVAQALSSSPAHARFSLGPKLVRHRANGLKNMHELGICHRDLKPENVLLKDDEVRICDLGASKKLDC